MHTLLLVLAVSAGPVIDSDHAPRALQQHAFDSIFRIDQEGKGTGFAVACNPLAESGKYAVFIVTAWHCVDGNSPITVHAAHVDAAPDYRGTFDAVVVAADKDADVAVLKAVCDHEVPCLSIARCDRPHPLPDRLPAITIGCSRGDYPTIWDVEIEGRQSHADLTGNPWVIDRVSIPGRSGGPLICTDFTDEDFGRVLGICSRNVPNHSYFADTERIRRCVRNADIGVDPVITPGDILFPTGFTLAALRVLIVAILSSFIRL